MLLLVNITSNLVLKKIRNKTLEFEILRTTNVTFLLCNSKFMCLAVSSTPLSGDKVVRQLSNI